MEWGDVALLCFLGLALWTFIPRPARAGLGDLVHGAADAVRSLVRSIAPVLSWLAYEVLLGVKRERVVNDYADDMSRTADEAGGTENAGTGSELRRTSENIPAPKTMLTDAEFAAVLAPLKRVDGSWWLSANKIHEIVGGQRADVLAVVRAARPEPSGEPSQPARMVTVRDRDGERDIPMPARRERYYDDPDLEYKSPAV